MSNKTQLRIPTDYVQQRILQLSNRVYKIREVLNQTQTQQYFTRDLCEKSSAFTACPFLAFTSRNLGAFGNVS